MYMLCYSYRRLHFVYYVVYLYYMWSSFRKSIILIMMFGMMHYKALIVVLWYGTVLMMGLTWAGWMAQNQSIMIIQPLQLFVRKKYSSRTGWSNVTKRGFCLGHLQRKIAHLKTLYLPPYSQYFVLISDIGLSAIFHMESSKGVVLTIALYLRQMQCVIFRLLKLQPLYMLWVMVHICGLLTRRMLIIGYPLNRNIGVLWLLNGLELYFYSHHYKWVLVVHVLYIRHLLMQYYILLKQKVHICLSLLLDLFSFIIIWMTFLVVIQTSLWQHYRLSLWYIFLPSWESQLNGKKSNSQIVYRFYLAGYMIQLQALYRYRPIRCVHMLICVCN